MATMPTPATKYTCPSTWSASTYSPTATSTVPPPTCGSRLAIPVPHSCGPCLPTTISSVPHVRSSTTTPTTTTSTVPAGTTAITRTSTTTPTTTVIPATPPPYPPSPICLVANVRATPWTATVATPIPTCLLWATSPRHAPKPLSATTILAVRAAASPAPAEKTP